MFERVLRDGLGQSFRVRIELDRGDRLEHEIIRLANKARDSQNSKCATAAGGVLRVCILAQEESSP